MMPVRKRFLMGLVLGICIMANVAGPAASEAAFTPMQPGVSLAGWVCAHGHSGHVENEALVVSPQNTRFGWGLDFQQAPLTQNWVHFSVPVPLFHKTRNINICFRTSSIDVLVTGVSVYMGESFIYSDELLFWFGSGTSTVCQGVNLASDTPVTGPLGVSLRVNFGSSQALSHQIAFSRVCADMIP